MVKIIVDCFGGDKSPDANVEGSLAALEKFSDLSLILTGDENILKEKLEGKKYDPSRLEILHAPEVVGCDEKPTDVIRLKKESSMMKAIKLLREDDSISGMVSAGSTGALVAAATLRIGRIRGIIRPAFCPILPTMNGGIVGICDSGANVDITADYLQQYAIMASAYLESVYGIEHPRVALLNIGTEETKGDDLRKTAYPLLESTKGINFVGNMESRDLLTGKYDVVVCDGFSGNVLVKSTEGACLEMLKLLKRDISSSIFNKIGALFMYKMFMKEKEFMNYQNYGGSILLGTEKTVVKGHGSSNARAIEKCIEQAYKTKTGGLSERIEAALAENQKAE
ncbi:MAG: phosphate acyltransferase PlsX [Clostridia bacterium]|nr:phosphate acyltransferase PlsX [Clostridia bacterium]